MARVHGVEAGSMSAAVPASSSSTGGGTASGTSQRPGSPDHVMQFQNSSGDSAGVTARKKRAAMLYEVKTPHSSMPLLHQVWMTFEVPSFSSAAFWYAQFSLFIITVSTITFCLETEINCKPFSVATHSFVTDANCETWEQAWIFAEIVAVVCFTAELLLRFISSPSKMTFLSTAMNWVDFVAVLPFFLEKALATATPTDEAGSGESNPLEALSVFRVIRLVRVFRVFKMGKSSSGNTVLDLGPHCHAIRPSQPLPCGTIMCRRAYSWRYSPRDCERLLMPRACL